MPGLPDVPGVGIDGPGAGLRLAAEEVPGSSPGGGVVGAVLSIVGPRLGDAVYYRQPEVRLCSLAGRVSLGAGQCHSKAVHSPALKGLLHG